MYEDDKNSYEAYVVEVYRFSFVGIVARRLLVSHFEFAAGHRGGRHLYRAAFLGSRDGKLDSCGWPIEDFEISRYEFSIVEVERTASVSALLNGNPTECGVQRKTRNDWQHRLHRLGDRLFKTSKLRGWMVDTWRGVFGWSVSATVLTARKPLRPSTSKTRGRVKFQQRSAE